MGKMLGVLLLLPVLVGSEGGQGSQGGSPQVQVA